jgi:hypothetical protein
MQILLYAIALIWAVSGFLLFSHPESFRQFFHKNFPPARIKSLAPVPAAVGIVLLIGAATADKLFWPLLVLGIAATAKGVYLFRTPTEKVKLLLDNWVFMADVGTLKRHGVLVFALGCALMAIVT